MTLRHLFSPRRDWSAAASARYAAFELAYTAVDAVAGLLFVSGSIMFLVGGPDGVARILFLIGSLMFVAKPLIRLAREIVLLGEGDTGALAREGGSHGGPARSAGHGDAGTARRERPQPGTADACAARRPEPGLPQR